MLAVWLWLPLATNPPVKPAFVPLIQSAPCQYLKRVMPPALSSMSPLRIVSTLLSMVALPRR